MATSILSVGHQEVSVSALDLTALTFVVGYREQQFKLETLPNRINVHRHPQNQLVGYIKRGSPTSGAIWKSGACVADYVVEDDGEYHVTEIKRLFRVPENTVSIDPVLYLLDSLLSEDSTG